MQNTLIMITSVLGIGAVILISMTLIGIAMGKIRDPKLFDMYGPAMGIFFIIFGAIKASEMNKENYAMDTAEYESAVSERLRPFGEIRLSENKVNTLEPAVTETAQPVQTVMTGPEVYNDACLICHGAGIGGAPVTGNADVWSSRIAQGYETLYQRAIEGYQGEAGYMPAKGARMDLADAEIRAAVDYMVSQSAN